MGTADAASPPPTSAATYSAITGVRVAELVRIRVEDVDLDACRIRITQGKGGKDRTVPFPNPFQETLTLHIDAQRAKMAAFLLESSWKKPYSTRGCERFSPATPPRPASSTTWPRTSCGTSSSPG